jgi:multiple RNA-binding domain-containing protein 1
MDQQTGRQDGPSWTTELLRPTSVDTQVAEAAADDARSRMVHAEADEAAALQRQQALEDVPEDDFLASLTAKTKAKDVEKSALEKEREIGNMDKPDDVLDAADDGLHHHHATSSSGPTLTDDQRTASTSRRVRIANIPYAATMAEVKNFVSSIVGDVEEVHLPHTKDTKQPKGIAFVTFRNSDAALRALDATGSIFMGRLVRINGAPLDPYKLKREEAAAAAQAAQAATAAAAGGEGGDAAAAAAAANASYKREKLEKKKRNDGDLMWNPLYMQSATAVAKVAQSLGVGAEAVVSVESAGAAVRAAVAEAYLTSEAMRTLGEEGINFGALEGASLHRNRSNSTILVKHLPKSLGVRQLAQMFASFGQLEAVAAPSSAAFCLIGFVHENDAKNAFQKLAYKMIGGTPLFLEWAPIGALNADATADDAAAGEGGAANKNDDQDDIAAEMLRAARRQTADIRGLDDDDDDAGARAATAATAADEEDDEAALPSTAQGRKVLKPTPKTAAPTTPAPAVAATAASAHAAHVAVATVYVTNLPFGMTDAAFVSFLQNTCKRFSANPEQVVRINLQGDKGRAFVTVSDAETATYCIAKLNGRSIEGRPIKAQLSHTTTTNLTAQGAGDAAAPTLRPSGTSCPPGRDPLKVMVKNLPFEATEKDLRQLFSSFSEVKAVRVPQKAHAFGGHHQNNHRGFGFVEFLTEQEAANAVATLRNTHLYGRHLVLEYARLE